MFICDVREVTDLADEEFAITGQNAHVLVPLGF